MRPFTEEQQRAWDGTIVGQYEELARATTRLRQSLRDPLLDLRRRLLRWNLRRRMTPFQRELSDDLDRLLEQGEGQRFSGPKHTPEEP